MWIRYHALALGLFWTAVAAGQEPQLASIFPAGGQCGTTVEITLEGKDLKAVRTLFFSHPDISAKKIADNRFAITIANTVPEADYDAWVVTTTGLTNPRRL